MKAPILRLVTQFGGIFINDQIMIIFKHESIVQSSEIVATHYEDMPFIEIKITDTRTKKLQIIELQFVYAEQLAKAILNVTDNG